MFTKKQQEIADRILKDVADQANHVWESDYMSDLQMQYPDNYHDCDYVLQSLVSDYRLLDRYGGGFLRLTPEGMEAAQNGFADTVRKENDVRELPIVEQKLKIIKILIEIAIAIAVFILGRCSSSVI